MKLSGLSIADDCSAIAVLSDDTAGVKAVTLVSIPADVFASWLDSSGDGVATYREDLTALAVAHKE
jgi:hypothetical protein